MLAFNGGAKTWWGRAGQWVGEGELTIEGIAKAPMTDTRTSLVPIESIAAGIVLLRGRKVILDSDLARLYGVTTKRLNEQVRRNLDRFPDDFAFQVTQEEIESLRLQNATSNEDPNLRSQIATSSGSEPENLRSQNATSRHGGRRYLPYAFTEHGAVMAASVLNSPRAVEISVYVVRAFIRLRELLSTHAELSQRLAELESKVDNHDQEIATLIDAIRQLMRTPDDPRRIGFRAE